MSQVDGVKVTVRDNAIELDADVDAIRGFGEVDADPIMRQISEQTGDTWGAVKLSGAWVISRVPAGSDARWNPVYGHRGENTRKFTKALGAATGRAIVQQVLFR